HHDDAGIVWPAPLAPYGAHVVPVNVGDTSLRETAESLADALEASGVDTLLDDREERPGVKFKDADLIGLPVRVTVGARALARGGAAWRRGRAGWGRRGEGPARGRGRGGCGGGGAGPGWPRRWDAGAVDVIRRSSDSLRHRLIFALDVDRLSEAEGLVRLLAPEVGTFKVGKQLFLQAGPEVVRMVHRHARDVFLDLKFHATPPTAAKAPL